MVLLLAAQLNAANLHGRIFDPHGALVTDTKLFLFDRRSGELRKALSGLDGFYEFLNIPDGEYLLEAEASDAALTALQTVIVLADTSRDMTLAISRTEVKVIVTASSTPLMLREVAKSLDVIDAEQIALRNEYSLVEAIRHIPGVRVQQLRGPGSLTTIQTRGLPTHHTAVLFDGLRFRDATSAQGEATPYLADMVSVNTEKIEFLRGSGSSLYGSHAVGGVLNINSHQGGEQPHGELRAEGGGLGMLRGVGRASGGLAGDRFVYSGGLSHLNVTNGYRDRSPYRNSSVNGFSKFSLTPKIAISGRVWASDAIVAANESPAFTPEILANFPASGTVRAYALPVPQLELFEQGLPFMAGRSTFIPSQIDPDNRNTTALLSGAFILQHNMTMHSSYRLAYQLVDTNRSYQDGPAGPSLYDPVTSTLDQYEGRIHLLQARTDHRLGAASLVSIGYEYEDEQYLNFNADESLNPVKNQLNIRQASHAIYAQEQFRLLDSRLNLSLSGRAQYFGLGVPSYSGSQSPYEDDSGGSPRNSYTGDVSAAYFLGKSQTKLRAHVGNSFRAPSLYERYGGSFSSFLRDFSYWGDPQLNPERAVAVDVGIDQWLSKSRLLLSSTVFYTNLQETVIFDFANFPANDRFNRFGGYRNSGGGIGRGVELSGQFTPVSSSYFQAAYTYTNSDSRTPTIGTDFFGTPGLSVHTFALIATRWITKRVNVTFDLFAVSDYILSPYGTQGRQMVFDGPVKADTVMRYELPVSDSKTLEFYGKVENVLNRDYYEDGFGSPGRWAIVGVSFRY